MIALGCYATTLVAFSSIIIASGHDLMVRDVGDTFDKAAEVAKYSAERLEAAQAGTALPDPPRIYADMVSVKIQLVSTSLYQVASIAVAGGLAMYASPGRAREVIRRAGLDRNPLPFAWRPALLVLAAYVGVIAYALLARAFAPDILVPQSTVPDVVTRDNLTLALAGTAALVLAPLAEECFFRGMVFHGLLRWGFWPAAAVSGLLFTGAHFDPGSLFPFFWVGIGMAWLYWSRGSL